MTNRRFFAIVFCMMLFFTAVFSGGCGGGSGGSINNSNNDNSNNDRTIITPTPNTSSSYTVTFESNGGTSIASQTVNAGSTIESPNAPTKSGNIFVGWYKDNNDFKKMFLFGPDGDKVTQDITLYAQWIEYNPSLNAVQYAISAISIGYSGGDNSKHVTGNLTLPTTVENFDSVTVTWSSSNMSIIRADGAVTRPGNDTQVKLYAIASSGSVSQNREFEVKVIHAHTRAKEDIPNSTITEIENMNVSNDEFYVGYNDDKTQVTDIDGKYTDIVIENAEDALDAVQSVHSVLGLNDPYSELQSSVTNSDEYGAEYSFTQFYNGVRVYGRKVMVSANASGDADFLRSNLIATEVLDSTNMSWTYSAEQAENAALEYCVTNYDNNGDFTAYSDDTEKIIYSFEDYENNPVPVYIVHVCGDCTISDDEYYLDCNLFVSALNGEIIDGAVINNDVTVTRNGELGRETFEAHPDDSEFFLFDPNTNVQIYSEKRFLTIPSHEPVKNSDASQLGDEQQVSAFVNVVRVMNWWRSEFNRNSLDNANMRVRIITHEKDRKNNAAWMFYDKYIGIGDVTKFDHSGAAALDVLAHETTHAVIQYIVGDDFATCYKKAPGAINEGYANIFGCIIEEDWKIAEAMYDEPDKCLRNMETPNDPNAVKKGPDRISSSLYVDFNSFPNALDILGIFNDHQGVHTNSFLISHAAYLMHEDSDRNNGLSWQTLGQVWYKSMSLGNYSKKNNVAGCPQCSCNRRKKNEFRGRANQLH